MMVYEKSARGYSEFTNNKRTLNVRERQVLLLVNGLRTLEDLEKFFKKEHLMEMLAKLEAGGFILPTQAYTATSSINLGTVETTPADIASTPKLSASTDFSMASLTTMSFFQTENSNTTLNAATMEAVKTVLIEATDDYLGLMGRAIRSRITACDSEAELRNCISSWHMAMRESKLGRESTSFLLQQIHHTLENKTIVHHGENSVSTGKPESFSKPENATAALAAANVVSINTLESNLQENVAKPIPASAIPLSVDEIAWSAPAIPAPIQKVNAREPSGFLKSAFG